MKIWRIRNTRKGGWESYHIYILFELTAKSTIDEVIGLPQCQLRTGPCYFQNSDNCGIRQKTHYVAT